MPSLPKPRLILIAGLHGSGKSTFIREHYGQDDLLIFDDLMARTQGDRREFRYCQYRKEILGALLKGQEMVLADVRFCENTFREDFFSELGDSLKTHEIVWHCFESNLSASLANIRFRAATTPWDHVLTEHAYNERLAKIYTYPTGAKVHPIFRAGETYCGLHLKSKMAPLGRAWRATGRSLRSLFAKTLKATFLTAINVNGSASYW